MTKRFEGDPGGLHPTSVTVSDIPFMAPEVKKVLETPSLPPAAAQPETNHEVWLKRGLVVLVAAAGVADQMLPEDSPWKHVVGVVFAVGAALGITSRGVQPKR